MTPATALELGRVSNLPTVWTNCLAGSLLAGAALWPAELGWILLAMSLMYLGGMFLNDACDARWDSEHKPDRPIPRGAATAREVWSWGIALLLAGPAICALRVVNGTGSLPAVYASLGLALAILAYDLLHKRARWSPWIMGGCRLLVYLCAGLATGALTPLLLAGGLSLLVYIAGITYVARAEHLNRLGAWWPLLLLAAPVALALWLLPGQPLSAITLLLLGGWIALRLRDLLPGPARNVPAGVGGLLAGISLVDASVLAGIGYWLAAGLAVAAFVATLLLQRLVAGT